MGKVTRQCPQTTTFGRERRAEAESNRSPSAHQPNALPLGQAGSQRHGTLAVSSLNTLVLHGLSSKKERKKERKRKKLTLVLSFLREISLPVCHSVPVLRFGMLQGNALDPVSFHDVHQTRSCRGNIWSLLVLNSANRTKDALDPVSFHDVHQTRSCRGNIWSLLVLNSANRTKDARWPENIDNAPVFPSASFVRLFPQDPNKNGLKERYLL